MMEPTPALLLVIALTGFLLLASALPPQLLLLNFLPLLSFVLLVCVCVCVRGESFSSFSACFLILNLWRKVLTSRDCWGDNVGEGHLTGPYLLRTMAGVSVHIHFPHPSQFCVR